MPTRTQLISGLALLAIPSILWFLSSRGQPFIAVAVLNTLIIAASVFLLLTPAEGGHDHDHDHASA